MTDQMIPADWQLAAEILGFKDSNQARASSSFIKKQHRDLASRLARHRIAHQGQVSGDVPVLLEEWLERRVYKGSGEYRSYLSARFPRTGGAPSPFDFDGHKWAYYVTSFDDKGEYDVIRRRVPKAATPTPTVKDSLTGDAAEVARQLNDESCGFGIGHAYLMQKAAAKLTELAAEVERLRAIKG